MVSPVTLIILANSATLVLGGAITVMAFRAFQRTNALALRALSIGIGFITAGTAIGGLLHQLFEMELIAAILLQNLCITAGFAVLVYSLWLPTDRTHESAITRPKSSD